MKRTHNRFTRDRSQDRGARQPAAISVTTVNVPQQLPAIASVGDDLTLIDTIGKEDAAQLKAMGVTTFRQLSAWDNPEVDQFVAAYGQPRDMVVTWVYQADQRVIWQPARLKAFAEHRASVRQCC